MRMRLLAGVSCAALALGASQAVGADLGVAPVAPVAPAFAPVTDWSGLYAGVHAGFGNADLGSVFCHGK